MLINGTIFNKFLKIMNNIELMTGNHFVQHEMMPADHKYQVHKDYYPNLNLGGGARLVPGWTNLDFTYGVSINSNLLKKIPEQSVKYIYTSHFLEHLAQKEAHQVLVESHRILKNGGILRITGPDLDSFVNAMDFSESDLDMWWSTVWPQRPSHVNSSQAFIEMGGDINFKNEPSINVGHIWPQTYSILYWHLIGAGFSRNNISKKKFLESNIEHVKIHQLDNRSTHSYYIEATKE